MPTSSVDICTTAHYDHANVACKSDDEEISDLSQDEVTQVVTAA